MVDGVVAPGLETVRETFEGCFAEWGETGAAFVALVGWRPVADLWGGDGFEHDPLVHVYSVTKPMSAFCVLMLLGRGAIGLDERMARGGELVRRVDGRSLGSFWREEVAVPWALDFHIGVSGREQ